MSSDFLGIAVTPSVRAAQVAMGSDGLWIDRQGSRAADRFTEREAAFISDRDSFFMATVSETGWPYVQHRGGPRGFLKLVDERTLAFADFRGNRQYLTVGNLAADDRTCLFLIDHARRARLKIYAHAEAVAFEADPQLARLVTLPDYKARAERILKLRLAAFDWNCSQHITPRFTEQELVRIIGPMQQRLQELEDENAALRARLDAAGDHA